MLFAPATDQDKKTIMPTDDEGKEYRTTHYSIEVVSSYFPVPH